MAMQQQQQQMRAIPSPRGGGQRLAQNFPVGAAIVRPVGGVQGVQRGMPMGQPMLAAPVNAFAQPVVMGAGMPQAATMVQNGRMVQQNGGMVQQNGRMAMAAAHPPQRHVLKRQRVVLVNNTGPPTQYAQAPQSPVVNRGFGSPSAPMQQQQQQRGAMMQGSPQQRFPQQLMQQVGQPQPVQMHMRAFAPVQQQQQQSPKRFMRSR